MQFSTPSFGCCLGCRRRLVFCWVGRILLMKSRAVLEVAALRLCVALRPGGRSIFEHLRLDTRWLCVCLAGRDIIFAWLFVVDSCNFPKTWVKEKKKLCRGSELKTIRKIPESKKSFPLAKRPSCKIWKDPLSHLFAICNIIFCMIPPPPHLF